MQDLELKGEELQNFTNEITAVLEKYNCEMGVQASIQILKIHGGETTEDTEGIRESTPETGSKSDHGE